MTELPQEGLIVSIGDSARHLLVVESSKQHGYFKTIWLVHAGHLGRNSGAVSETTMQVRQNPKHQSWCLPHTASKNRNMTVVSLDEIRCVAVANVRKVTIVSYYVKGSMRAVKGNSPLTRIEAEEPCP